MTSNKKLPTMFQELTMMLELAIRYHRNGELDAAATIYRKVLDSVPDHPEALHLLGVVHHQKGRSGQAIQFIRQALQVTPENGIYYYNLGEAQYAVGAFAEAIASYRAAIRLGNSSPGAWNRIGLIEQNHFRKLCAANEAYKNALKLDPAHIPALNNYGLLLLSQQDYNEARNLFLRVLSLDQNHAEALLNLAITCELSGDFATALDYCRKALKLPSGPSGIRQLYIRLLQNCCNWEQLALELKTLTTLTDRQLAAGHRPEESPFLNLTHSFSSRRNLAIARAWSRELINSSHQTEDNRIHAHS